VTELGAQPIHVPEKQLLKAQEAEKRISEEEEEGEEGQGAKPGTGKKEGGKLEKEDADADGEEEGKAGKDKKKGKGKGKGKGESSEDGDGVSESTEDSLEEPPAEALAEDKEEEDWEEYMKSITGVVQRKKKDYVTIGFIGSPNVGKSTLVRFF
jgi:hypothetical protein